MSWRDTIKKGETQTPKSWRDTIVPANKPEYSGLESAGMGALQGVTLGNVDEGTAAGRSFIDDLKAVFSSEPSSGPEVVRDEHGRVVNADQLTGNYDQYVQEERAKYKQAEADNPSAYFAGQVAGGVALPGSSVKALALQGGVAGFGGSEADNAQDLAVDTVTGAGLGAGLAKGGQMVGKGLSKVADSDTAQAVKNAIMNSKYAKAFREGADVQKYVDPNVQTDLANRVSDTINDKVAQARIAHANARDTFTRNLGDTSIDASDVAKHVEDSVGLFGPNAMSASGKELGAITGKDAELLNDYVETLKSTQSASDLYRIWDDIKRNVSYYDTLGPAGAPVNQQLQALQNGIKQKLHVLDPNGLATADKAMSQVADQSALLRPGANEGTAESFLSTLGNRNRGNRREAFEQLVGDTPVAKEVDNFQTYKSFEGQGGFGSDYGLRNAAGIALGGGIGYAAGGDSTSGTIGSVIGGALASGRTQRALITKAGETFKKLGISESALAKMPAKYKSILEKAAQQGGRSLAITHFLLSNEDEEYQKAMSQP